jgi:hypothetical protein
MVIENEITQKTREFYEKAQGFMLCMLFQGYQVETRDILYLH